MSIFTVPWDVVLDPATNTPAAGALLYFYVSGTTTLTDTYSDSALTTPNANPVVCDGNGRTPSIYCKTSVSYKIVLKTSDGRTIQTIDPYDPTGALIMPVQAVGGTNYTYGSGDRANVMRRNNSGAMSDTLSAAPSMGAGYFVVIHNFASYNITLSVDSGGTIDGNSTLTIYPGQMRTLRVNSAVLNYVTDPAPLTTGKRFLPLAAGFFFPAQTNGCDALAFAETTTNKINYAYLAHSNVSTQYSCCTTSLPPGYDGLAFEWQAVWTVGSGSAGDTAGLILQARMFADDDALDGTWGTASTVSDTVLAVGDVHVSPWTSITPANAGPGKLMALRFARDSATGTLAQKLRLIEVRIRPSLANPNDA